MFKTVLIANRGEIAVRAIRTLKKMNIRSVAIYSDTDKYAPHVYDADVAIPLDGTKPIDSYLRIDKIIDIAINTGAEAIFPGYGFLSESTEFAKACIDNNIIFIGPTLDQINNFGLKHKAKELAFKAKVPMTPGTGLLNNLEETLIQAEKISYPVMLKSTAGGGGIGLTKCDNKEDLIKAYNTTKHLSEQYFKDSRIFLEKFIDKARHIEVQILGDGNGNVYILGERDCSIQRRNQKVIEETPAPNFPNKSRQKLYKAATNLAKLVKYKSAGTVEFIYDEQNDKFYFLEVNTRLQVEHPITEMVTGLDIIELMLKIANNEPLNFTQNDIVTNGTSIEARIYAENAVNNFQPSPGTLIDVSFPTFARIDTGVNTGTEVSSYFDPMIAKVIVHGQDREQAIKRLKMALTNTKLYGICTNLDYIRQIINTDNFKKAKIWTKFLDDFDYKPYAIEVISPGTHSSIQDYPGRLGYWDIGVPPSGPMDAYAFQIANTIVGNPHNSAGLEFTLQGPTLKFYSNTIIALTGATCDAYLDDKKIQFWKAINVKAGQFLKIGSVEKGCRTYLAVRNGFDVPLYLGSRSTFYLGKFGGNTGNIIKTGEVIYLAQEGLPICYDSIARAKPIRCNKNNIPKYTNHWKICVMYGPHGAPDFFESGYIKEFFNAIWEVHFNSNRLGIRLNGPKPKWTRKDGGEAGMHPSNIHDCEYAIGSINFTGDFPVILSKDGPSLGGFVCPLTIVKAELWKIGQLRPGDKITFIPITLTQANYLYQSLQNRIRNIDKGEYSIDTELELLDINYEQAITSAILTQLPMSDTNPKVTYRQAGDGYILLEYGEDILDLSTRLRVHQLMREIRVARRKGIEELSPGVRSLQIRYNDNYITQKELLTLLIQIENEIGDLKKLSIPSRIINLPMAFEDSDTLKAVKRYQETVVSEAPWLPNNVDFIQRINGLANREDVKNIVFSANYLILGLGDVYLTAPCAVPIDPRHRLLSSKYNPARTFTPEGTVGIGGMYMCIYGMDSPGGYQLVGRTLPIWNKFRKNSQFKNKEWFLEMFDQIKFYEVSEEKLDYLREKFANGNMQIEIINTRFNYKQYQNLLDDNKKEIEKFRIKQQKAFAKESKHFLTNPPIEIQREIKSTKLTKGDLPINVNMTGNIWKIMVKKGDNVKKGDTLAIIEAMKMEIHINTDESGIVKDILYEPGENINNGDTLLILKK